MLAGRCLIPLNTSNLTWVPTQLPRPLFPTLGANMTWNGTIATNASSSLNWTTSSTPTFYPTSDLPTIRINDSERIPLLNNTETPTKYYDDNNTNPYPAYNSSLITDPPTTTEVPSIPVEQPTRHSGSPEVFISVISIFAGALFFFMSF
jgi:hypothetical protein